MTYQIIDSMPTLTDTGANTVDAGIYLPNLPTSAATYTDTGITIEYNGLTEDPQYEDAANFVFIPWNTNLEAAGWGGVDIGAVAVGSSSAVILTAPTDGNPSVAEPITFSWEAFAGALDYQLQIATENTFASPVIDQVVSGQTTYQTSALNAGQQYYWRVRARLS
jgi:hypothetical protein